MDADLDSLLDEFVKSHKFSGKGPLSVALFVTDRAREKGLPLDADDLLTAGGGQVQGLSKGAVQSILKRHGIEQVLAQEGGRTSRGSLQRMRVYVEFLNGLDRPANLDAIEAHWIARVRAFFAGKPFVVRMDASRGLRHMVRDLLEQAEERQRQSSGTNFVGTVMQHLVGAKLECVLSGDAVEHSRFSTAGSQAVSRASPESGPSTVEHFSASAADAQAGRPGDFHVGDVAIHVTAAPGEAVVDRCRQNLDRGLRPVLVTVPDRVPVAEAFSRDAGIEDRIDIFEIEQFIALNLYEIGVFEAKRRELAVRQLVNAYNSVIERAETDPSLRIEFQQ